MEAKLIITKQNNHIISALFEDDKIAELSVEPIEEKKLLGNIYTGKVKNIVKNINAAFVEVEDGLRLERALKREQQENNHKYAEMCRRFLADSEDFSEDNLKAAEIGKRYENIDFELCLLEIVADIQREKENL